MRPETRDGFQIAIICALTLEADAVEALFDETYDKFSRVYGRESGDNNAYITGRIGQHNVVLCYLPGMGRGSAAAASANLRVTYKHIQLVLVVGICGGVPFTSDKCEIILGDIIISNGVIQYDFGRQNPDGFVHKSDVQDTLGRPNQEIRAFLAALGGRKTRTELQERTHQHLQTLQKQSDNPWHHPGTMYDTLFESSYRHKHYNQDTSNSCICSECRSGDDNVCDQALKGDCDSLGCAGKMVPRQRLAAQIANPSIFIGKIASADTVMKSGEHRDSIAESNGVIGFEMEGAGVWDNMPCIIIKGVCDYADSHKNKLWQHYGAATAACTTKSFLEYWAPKSLDCEFIHPEINVVDDCHQMRHQITCSAALIMPSTPFKIFCSLCDFYTSARRLHVRRISGELLPMDQCYINLAVVVYQQSSGATGPSQYSPFSEKSRLDVERVDAKSRVSLLGLFEHRKGSDGRVTVPRRVLIQGRAGVGKTTLCKKIMYDHIYGEMWRGLFDSVIWVPLRQLKSLRQEHRTLEGMFHDLYFSELPDGKDLARGLQNMLLSSTHGDRILLVLDGLDDVSHEWDSETPMHNLLLRLLDHPRVIITSRPFGMNLNDRGLIDLELEIIGFDLGQVEAYVEKVLKDDDKKRKAILDFVHDYELIKSLVRIPIQLDAVCYTWDRNYMTPDQLKTSTSLYQAITLKLWHKDILRLKRSQSGQHLQEDVIHGLSASQVQELAPTEVNLLEILAFSGIFSEVIEFNANDRHRIYDSLKMHGIALPEFPEETLRKMSFLHTSDSTLMIADQSHHFLHLTFQEFFAAQYFVRHWLKDEQLLCIQLRSKTPNTSCIFPRALLQNEKYKIRYDIVWRFAAGLLGNVPSLTKKAEVPIEKFFQQIQSPPRDFLGSMHRRLLMNCLAEVIRDTEINWSRVDIEDHISSYLEFEITFFGFFTLASYDAFPEYWALKLLQTGDPYIQEGVLGRLMSRHSISPKLLDYLLYLLQDGEYRVREAALRAMACQSYLPKSALQAIIIAKAKSGNHGELFGLDRHLAGCPEALEYLVPYLKDSDSIDRAGMAGFLAQQSHTQPWILDILLPLLKEPGSMARKSIADGLRRNTSLAPRIVEALLPLLTDEENTIRSAAARALGAQSALAPAIIQRLLPLLEDENGKVRRVVAHTLGTYQEITPAILQGLLALLKSDSRHTRRNALEAIARHPGLPVDILQVVLSHLEGEERNCILAAAETLYKQPPLPPIIIESLFSILRSGDYRSRYAAASVLRQQPFCSTATLDAFQNHPMIIDYLHNNPASFANDIFIGMFQQLPLGTEAATSLVALLSDVGWKMDVCTSLWKLNERDRTTSGSPTCVMFWQDLPYLSPPMFDCLVNLLDHADEDVRHDAYHVINGRSPLPPAVIDSLLNILRGKNTEPVIKSACELLSKESNLPTEAIMTLHTKLTGKDFLGIQGAILVALGRQPYLPTNILESLLPLMYDDDTYNRLFTHEYYVHMMVTRRMWDQQLDIILRNHKILDSGVPSKYLRHLYLVWLGRSFREQVSCCLVDNYLLLDMPEGLCKIPVKREHIREIEKLQRRLNHPDSVSQTRGVISRLTRGRFSSWSG